MEFRTFLNAFMRLPCQIVRAGRRVVFRLLAWNRWLPALLRGIDALRQPLRCQGSGLSPGARGPGFHQLSRFQKAGPQMTDTQRDDTLPAARSGTAKLYSSRLSLATAIGRLAMRLFWD